jgi:hypothetical protein
MADGGVNECCELEIVGLECGRRGDTYSEITNTWRHRKIV